MLSTDSAMARCAVGQEEDSKWPTESSSTGEYLDGYTHADSPHPVHSPRNRVCLESMHACDGVTCMVLCFVNHTVSCCGFGCKTRHVFDLFAFKRDQEFGQQTKSCTNWNMLAGTVSVFKLWKGDACVIAHVCNLETTHSR